MPCRGSIIDLFGCLRVRMLKKFRRNRIGSKGCGQGMIIEYLDSQGCMDVLLDTYIQFGYLHFESWGGSNRPARKDTPQTYCKPLSSKPLNPIFVVRLFAVAPKGQ